VFGLGLALTWPGMAACGSGGGSTPVAADPPVPTPAAALTVATSDAAAGTLAAVPDLVRRVERQSSRSRRI
jgi:hypothetical protein